MTRLPSFPSSLAVLFGNSLLPADFFAPKQPTQDAASKEATDLVLELLSIFPNSDPTTVLDGDDTWAQPSDYEVVARVVPRLRELLRNHPTEVARRKTRKVEQKELSKERKALRTQISELAEKLDAAKTRLDEISE